MPTKRHKPCTKSSTNFTFERVIDLCPLHWGQANSKTSWETAELNVNEKTTCTVHVPQRGLLFPLLAYNSAWPTATLSFHADSLSCAREVSGCRAKTSRLENTRLLSDRGKGAKQKPYDHRLFTWGVYKRFLEIHARQPGPFRATLELYQMPKRVSWIHLLELNFPSYF